MKQPTVISLFAGCGGSSLGYKLAGFKELLAIDYDDDAVETFKLNFPDIPIWKKDITKISGDEILNFCKIKKGELDVLDGSPPCQGFSMAGKRRINDPRNDLVNQYIRLISEIQPKVFVMENVSGMIKGTMKGLFNSYLWKMRDMTYTISCKLLNAKYYNVPQSRQRIFIIGRKKDVSFKFPEHKKIITVKEAFKSLPKQKEDRPMEKWLKKAYYEILPMQDREITKKIFKKYKGTTSGAISTIRLNWNKPSPTITKSEISVSGLLHPSENRYLTEMELKRLSSFPDYFKFTNRLNACKRIGNSVPPQMMKAIADSIKKQLL